MTSSVELVGPWRSHVFLLIVFEVVFDGAW